MSKRSKSKTGVNNMIDPILWARDSLSADQFQNLMRNKDEPIPAAIRINLLKSTSEDLIDKCDFLYQWKSDPVPFCPSGFWITDSKVPLSRTIEHKLGYYYIQESASMLPVELFDFSGIDRPLILDMAASPGGKTTHLVDKIADRGLVIANDASRSRIPALKVVLQNWGAINTAITARQGEWFGEAYPGTFDAVLLDAPCSMQGLRTSASHRSRTITQIEIEALANRQVNMLESALLAVKTGGQVVYSTCTLSPNENEQVLTTILDRFPGQVEIADIQDKIPVPAPALPQFGEIQFQPEVQRAARLWPHIFGTAGFFSAKLIKKGEFSHAASSSEGIQNGINNFDFLSPDEASSFSQFILDTYGFDLCSLLENQDLSLTKSHRDIYLVPNQFLRSLSTLPTLAYGMRVGREVSRGWQPSHEFVSRFGDQFISGTYLLDHRYIEAWLRGEDIRGLSVKKHQSGQIVNIRDHNGRNFGRGKVLNDRLKNMLPTRLF